MHFNEASTRACGRAYKPRPQNKTNPWFMALKEFNKDRPTWTIPKRGEGKKPLPDYNKVMQMKEKFEWKQCDSRCRRGTDRSSRRRRTLLHWQPRQQNWQAREVVQQDGRHGPVGRLQAWATRLPSHTRA